MTHDPRDLSSIDRSIDRFDEEMERDFVDKKRAARKEERRLLSKKMAESKSSLFWSRLGELVKSLRTEKASTWSGADGLVLEAASVEAATFDKPSAVVRRVREKKNLLDDK